jgi:ElaB/YqjD/DUF883 family membrane-anchored ribosome-binding protein
MTKHGRAGAHKNLKSHARELVKATEHIADEKVSEARHKLSEIIESVSDAVETAEDAVMEKVETADNFIRENPYKTAAIALGVGALIGMLVLRRGNSD